MGKEGVNLDALMIFGAMMKFIQKEGEMQGMNECRSHSACLMEKACSVRQYCRSSWQPFTVFCELTDGSRFDHRASPPWSMVTSNIWTYIYEMLSYFVEKRT